jgi:hypothetical protein
MFAWERSLRKEVTVLKRRIAVILPILALATAPMALAAGAPSGTYKTTITKPAKLKGVWKVTFKSGHVTARFKGHVAARNTYTISGSTITFPPKKGAKCTSPGMYTFMLSGKTLTFTKISDPCSKGRAAVLTHKFTKV